MSGRWMLTFVVLAVYGGLTQNTDFLAAGTVMVGIGVLINVVLHIGPTHFGGDLE